MQLTFHLKRGWWQGLVNQPINQPVNQPRGFLPDWANAKNTRQHWPGRDLGEEAG
jgi:hypothetical protein